MKRSLTIAIAPMLMGLLTGCSSHSAMQSTEYDDMYYSSKDKTEYVQPEAEASEESQTYDAEAEQPLAEGQAVNPEYSAGSSSSVIDNYYGDEYYDGRDYDPRDNWYRPSYSFIDPYWSSAAYYPSTYYGYSRYHRYNPYYDPFYDPFYDPIAYSPYWSPYRSGLSISLGFNYGWGRYGWNPYRPYYGRYGWGGYYDGFYQGFYQGYYTGHGYGYWNDRPYGVVRKVQYGPRGERGGVRTDAGGRDSGRNERGTLSGGNEQRAVNPAGNTGTVRPGRPARTERSVGAPATGSESKQVLPSRPRTGEAAPRVERSATRERQLQQQEQRLEQRQVRPRTEQVQQPRRQERRREYTPTQSVPSRQYNQPVQRERTERRSYEQRSSSSYEQRSTSSPSYNNSNSSSGSNNSNRSSGRPPRGN